MDRVAPLLVLIAGPNGAGKSTFYECHLSRFGLYFLNADKLAREQFGERAAQFAREAAVLATNARLAAVENGESFVFETVLSDPVGDKVAFCRQARESGYFIDAHFIGLNSPHLSRARVLQRVALGGHDVPDEKLDSRFPRTLDNLARLVTVANRLTIYDNSEVDRPHRPVALFENGCLIALSPEVPGWLDFLDLPSLAGSNTRSLP